MRDPARILVIRRRAIGDVLVSVDVLRALRERWPEARIDFVVNRASADMVRGSGLIDELVIYDRRMFSTGSLWSRARATISWLSSLRRRRPDLVLDLLGTPQTALWTAWTGAAVRVGARRRNRTWAYNRPVEAEDQLRFAGERFLDWVRILGIDPGPWRPHAPLAATTAAASLEPATDTRPLVILNPSATWAAKAWPVECFGELGRQLGAGCDVRVAWGPGEETQRDRIVELGGGAIQALPPTDLPSLGAWLERAALLVTTDSGPKHLAVAMGTATLTVFGSTDPRGWQPPGARHRWLTAPIDCHPCNLTVCPVPGHPCLDDLSASRVATEAQAMLHGGGGHG